MCELCSSSFVVPGKRLCAVCGEAIARVALAVKRIEAEADDAAIKALYRIAEVPQPTVAISADEYRAAFFGLHD